MKYECKVELHYKNDIIHARTFERPINAWSYEQNSAPRQTTKIMTNLS